MKVSIIIPVYNTEEFLTDCLNSVIDQTYKNIEIIIVNDASEDNSRQLINDYQQKDDRVLYYEHQENLGVGASRNLGVEKSTGDYIYFLDSDDILPKETIELLVRFIGSNIAIKGSIKNSHLTSAFTVTFEGNFNPKTYTDNRLNLLNNPTSNNYLISRLFIIENELKHSEEKEYFSDLYFMVPLLEKLDYIQEYKEAIYFRRLRNDPILNPSLNQKDKVEIIDDFLGVYMELKLLFKESELINEFLDTNLLNYYRKEVILSFRNKKNINTLFSKLHEAVKMLNSDQIKQADYVLRKELTLILHNKIGKYKRVLNRFNFFRALKRGMKTRRRLYIFLYQHIFTKLPMKKNLVFFESFLGKNYSDSPKYIYEYMLENKKGYKFVWSFNEDKQIPGNSKQVKRFSLKYFYMLARAKYWVSNSRLPKYLTKREGNVYLQTWHGTPLKRLVFDMNDIYSADPNYKLNFYEQSRRWDYLSSPNNYSSEIFRKSFLFEKEMLEFGYPRNDILYTHNNSSEINKLKKKMNIPKDKKVILYAPTWRDDDFIARGKYNFSLKLDLADMKKKLGEDYVVLLRMHYFIANALDLDEFKGFAYDFSSYDDIAELYLVSDILITDYSSVFFDYANLKRPILYFTYDLEKYRDTLRGFYLDIEKEVPGPLLQSSEEVVHAIQNIEEINKTYKNVYDEFYNRFCLWDDGMASKNTVNRVFE